MWNLVTIFVGKSPRVWLCKADYSEFQLYKFFYNFYTLRGLGGVAITRVIMLMNDAPNGDRLFEFRNWFEEKMDECVLTDDLFQEYYDN